MEVESPELDIFGKHVNSTKWEESGYMVLEGVHEGSGRKPSHHKYASPWTDFEVSVSWIGDDLLRRIGFVEIERMLEFEEYDQNGSLRDEFRQHRSETTPRSSMNSLKDQTKENQDCRTLKKDLTITHSPCTTDQRVCPREK